MTWLGEVVLIKLEGEREKWEGVGRVAVRGGAGREDEREGGEWEWE